MNRKTITIGIIVLGILSISLIFTLSTYLVTQAMDPGDGGGISPPPSPPPPPPEPDDPSLLPIEAPTLFPINPLTDNDGDITLDWFNVNGATFYEVYRRDNGTTFLLIKSGIVDSMYFDIDLSEGYYDYYIIASNGVDYSKPSETKTVQVLIPLPIAPTLRPIWPSMSETGNVSLEWSGYANKYNIYRAKDSGSFILIESDVSSSEYLDEVFSDGNYQYYVTAIENQKESEPSNIKTVHVSLTQVTLPDAPAENDYIATIFMSFVVCIGIVAVCLIIRLKRYKSK